VNVININASVRATITAWIREHLSGARSNRADCVSATIAAREQCECIIRLEEASTHKSAKTHAGIVFVTRDLDL